MKNTKFIKPLYRTEDKLLLDELLDIMNNKGINLEYIDTYMDSDNIYNLELNIKDMDIKFKLIKIIKIFVKKKILSYNGKMSLYTFLSRHIPDKALSNYKINTSGLTTYASDEYKGKYYGYTLNDNVVLFNTKEEAIKECLKFAYRKAFHYITGRMYL